MADVPRIDETEPCEIGTSATEKLHCVLAICSDSDASTAGKPFTRLQVRQMLLQEFREDHKWRYQLKAFDPEYLSNLFMVMTYLFGAMIPVFGYFELCSRSQNFVNFNQDAKPPFSIGNEQFSDGIMRPRVDITTPSGCCSYNQPKPRNSNNPHGGSKTMYLAIICTCRGVQWYKRHCSGSSASQDRFRCEVEPLETRG